MLQNHEDTTINELAYSIALQLRGIMEELITIEAGENGNLQLIDIVQKLDRVHENAHNSIYDYLAEEGFQIEKN